MEANPMRQLFKGMKQTCMSWDAKTGYTHEGEWKDEHDCSECKYKKGVEEEGEKEPVKCKLSGPAHRTRRSGQGIRTEDTIRFIHLVLQIYEDTAQQRS
jgi:hypothetical protein